MSGRLGDRVNSGLTGGPGDRVYNFEWPLFQMATILKVCWHYVNSIMILYVCNIADDNIFAQKRNSEVHPKR